MKTTISAAIIQDNKLLLVRKRETWIFPGGKLEPGEGDLECLCREVKEELSETKLKNIRFYNSFEGRTPHGGDIIRVKVFHADINGQLYGVRKEDSISEARWIGDFSQYNLSEITHKAIASLRRDSYL